MSGRFPFDLHLKQRAGPPFGGPGRRARLARSEVAIRFDYPPLEGLAAPERPPTPAVTPEPSPAPAAFSEEELRAAVETARQEAAAATEERVRTEMLASLERRQADALNAISGQLAASQERLERMVASRAGASRELALAAARALVARALDQQPLADVEAMFRELVVRLEGMPWLELRLAADLLPAAEVVFARAADEADYRGELRLVPDARLGPGEALLSWQDGVAERGLSRLDGQVAMLIEDWLPATATTAVGAAETGSAQAAAARCLREPPATCGPAVQPADPDQAGVDGLD
jgi:flagellar biosynthesis/type III secretory pathway protein FliH